MTFFDLILRNLWKKKARSIGLLLAVAVAVMTVVALDVTSSGLEQSAAAIISIGKADFTVAQKGASSTLTSTIDTNELTRIRQTPGVQSAVGVLVETEHINADNPVFIEIGIQPSDLSAFGVKVVAGHSLRGDEHQRGHAGVDRRGQPRTPRRRSIFTPTAPEHSCRHLFDR